MDEGRELIAGPDDAGRRLDKVLRALLGARSLSSIYVELRKGRIRVNGARAGPGLILARGDRIFVRSLPGDAFRGEQARDPATANASADEPHQDDELASIADILILATRDLIFINKPWGELSQGAAAIEGRIREALARRSASSLSFTPGPLHRLDRNTTGVLTFPRSAEGGASFPASFVDEPW